MSEDSHARLPHQTSMEGHRSSLTPISSFGWVMILMLCILGAINFADKAALGLAALPIIKELQLSPIQYGLVSGSIFWLFSLSSMVVTPLADRVGTKRMLSLLATTWAVAQFATAFIATFFGLLLVRVVLGAGEGPSYGTSVASASKWLPLDRRAFGLGIVSFGNSIGPAVFAPLLTFVIILVGWRAAFALLGMLGIFWVIIWLLVARERSAGDRAVVKTRVIRKGVRWSQFFHVNCTHTIMFSILVAFSVYWNTALLLNWTPIYLSKARHLSLTDPLYLLGISLPWMLQGLTLIFFGVLADRLMWLTGSMRKSHILPVGALLLLSSVSFYAAVNISSELGSVLLLSLGAMSGGSIPILVSILLKVTPEIHQGFTLGIAVGLATLAGFIAPLVTGLIVQAAGKDLIQGLNEAYMLAAVLLLACNGLFVIFVRPDEAIAVVNPAS